MSYLSSQILFKNSEIAKLQFEIRAYLEEAGENVKLKNGDVPVASEVDGGSERDSHRTGIHRVDMVESFSELCPGHQVSAEDRIETG